MSRDDERGSWRGPIAVIAGLSGVVITNLIMIGIALSHPSLPASVDHWAESLAWEQELERRAHSRELGWSIAALAREGQALELTIVDAEQRPLAGLRGSVTLRRADRGDDHELSLVERGEGRYRGEPAIPSAGLYELTVALEDPSGEQFSARRWLDLAQLDVAEAK
ncbi:FixH family protein [Nannocystaceae bacterium ST9]